MGLEFHFLKTHAYFGSCGYFANFLIYLWKWVHPRYGLKRDTGENPKLAIVQKRWEIGKYRYFNDFLLLLLG